MHSSRRVFLGAVTAASYKRLLGANDRIQIGFIGYGLIGRQHPDDRFVSFAILQVESKS